MRAFAVPTLVVALLASAVAGAGASDSVSCGEPGKPACPLQHWMRMNAARPLATGDFAALEQSFTRIAALNPDPAKWGNWSKIAKDGAEHARAKNESGARGACGRCHRAYRRAYNARYRKRVLDAE